MGPRLRGDDLAASPSNHCGFAAPPARLQVRPHVRRHRRRDADRIAVLGQWHDNVARMELQPRTALPRRIAVDGVAQDRKTFCRAMDAQLVGAAGERLQRQPGLSVTPPQHFPCRHGRLAGVIVLHPPAACRIEASERQVDAAFVLGRAAFHHGPIAFPHRPFLNSWPSSASALRCRPSTRQPEVSRSSRWASAGARAARSAARRKVLETFAALRAAMHARPAGLSMTSIRPSR